MSVGAIYAGHPGSVENSGGGPPAPGSAVTSVVAGDGGIVVTNPTGPSPTTISQTMAAEWPIATTRVYALDGVNGNDANKGYADPATSSAGDYATACAAAGAVAKKTFAGLAAIFPRVGNGRKVEIVILGGGTVYSGTIGDVLNGVSGYANACPFVRGTATQATAGSVAFAGTTQDVTFAGAQNATGMNATGYNPVAFGVTTTSIQLAKVGGGSPSFAAQPAVPLGWRIRFDSATATASLRNVCRQVSAVVGSDTVQVQTALPAVASTSDVCYLEMAGFSQGALTLQGMAQLGTGSQGLTIVGLQTTGTFTVGAGFVLSMSFIGVSAFSGSGLATVLTQQQQTHPVLGSITFGGGLRSETTIGLSGSRNILSGAVSVTDTTITSPAGSSFWGAGCAARALNMLACHLIPSNNAQQNPNVGTALAAGIPQLFGVGGTGASLFCDGSDFSIGTLVITGAGANPCIKPTGKNTLIFKGIVSGTTGNNDVGIDFRNAFETDLVYGSLVLPTVTGANGDIRYSNGALGFWVSLNNEEMYDTSGNHLRTSAPVAADYANSMSPSVFSAVNNNGAPMDAYSIVKSTGAGGASGQINQATAATVAGASGVMGVLLAAANNGSGCLVGGSSGYKLCKFESAPTLGAIAYLSDSVATPGSLTTTVPGNNGTRAKLRIGIVCTTANANALAVVRMTPEVIAVLADGNP